MSSSTCLPALVEKTTQPLCVYVQKAKCLNPPRTARRVENYIQECQEEVKNKLVSEAYDILKHEVSPTDEIHEEDEYLATTEAMETVTYPYYETNIPSTHLGNKNENSEENPSTYHTYNEMPIRRKRTSEQISPRRSDDIYSYDYNEIYHPTLVPPEDKRIAGCLLHCVYAKNNAIDKMGWPTLDGLVHFYSEGVNDHGFFMATLRSVNLCLHAVSKKYRVSRSKYPEQGESCDVAFDVFDCISDQITGYCLDNYKH
ncbi:uncharacterized protein LOC119678968 [Teleopsis dalmanni]|uniref:uncharacterized protein LOC119678968 n=1 Tax=Teleopsis dalmanni TaxID=139649 RepID=UPI0018CDD81F|nr:uncharacterized protein LOC119678968 [Teleopsis dalmanni]